MSPLRQTRPTLRRGLAVGLTASMAAVGAVAAIPTAQAATGATDYTCTYDLFGNVSEPFTLSVDTDTNAPAKMAPGEKFDASVTTSTSLPGNMAQLAYNALQSRFFDGTSAANFTVSGTAAPVAQTIPVTAITTQPPNGTPGVDVPFKAAGAMSLTAPATPGSFDIVAGDFTTTLALYGADADGNQGAEQLKVPVTCLAPKGKPIVVDTVAVVAPSATILTLDKAWSRYGDRVTATAKVTTAAGAPDGEVAFTLNGVATKARVNKDGIATLALPTAPVGSHNLTASFVPKDATAYEGSTSAPVAFKVAKAKTRPKVAVTGKRTNRATKVKVTIKTQHDTTATGKVRIVLRKIGTKKKWVRNRALKDGQRTVGFGKLKKGRYKVIVRYRGDDNHMRGPRAVRKFRVKKG
jgi:hypothetical protein